jgi:LCP family protein required for cell wall assembly
VILTVGIAVVVLLLAGAGVVTWGLVKLNSINRVDVKLAGAGDSEPQNFLVVGSDTRDIKDTSPDAAAVFGGGKGDAEPAGQRADTMLIMRVEPAKTSLEVLSLPRDLWVTTSSGSHERLNAAYNSGAQNLIDTIQTTFGIEINHYVEVNFVGFKGLVEAVGGVPMYFGAPMRDRNTGLNIIKAGCYNLDGIQALAFARSRHLEYKSGSRWVSDPTGDLGRITRQQTFLRRALSKVTGLGIGDWNTLRKLIDVGVDSVRIDKALSIGTMRNLGSRFSKFNAQTMVTHRLPANPVRTDAGASVLQMDAAAAAPTLAIFQGKAPATTPSTTAPGSTPAIVAASVTADVMNGTAHQGLARQTGDSLAIAGFELGSIDTVPATTQTTIKYGKGGLAAAQLLASRITPTPVLTQVSTLKALHVELDIGSDFTKVSSVSPTSTTTASGPPAADNNDKPIGYITGDPPPGVKCGSS